MILRVDTAAARLTAGDRAVPCVIGRGGACDAADKREGDGRTPRGTYPIRAALLRPDRVAAPATSMPWRWLRLEDGWSDDPADPAYNRPVRHPHRFSAERLWRDDGLYDLIVILGHNDTPAVAGFGSAIFLHCAPPEGRSTEGCAAIPRDELVGLLPMLTRDSAIIID